MGDGVDEEEVNEFKEEVKDTTVVEHLSKCEIKMINNSTTT
jgi:hypothetical protein